MLSLVSLGIKQKINPEILLFLGSVASAINVNSIGNKIAVNLSDVDRFLNLILNVKIKMNVKNIKKKFLSKYIYIFFQFFFNLFVKV